MPIFEKRTVVEAVRIYQEMAADTTSGSQKGEPGDWLVTEGNTQYFVKNDDFLTRFIPKSELAEALIESESGYLDYTEIMEEPK